MISDFPVDNVYSNPKTGESAAQWLRNRPRFALVGILKKDVCHIQSSPRFAFIAAAMVVVAAAAAVAAAAVATVAAVADALLVDALIADAVAGAASGGSLAVVGAVSTDELEQCRRQIQKAVDSR